MVLTYPFLSVIIAVVRIRKGILFRKSFLHERTEEREDYL